ncbi:MAG: alpha/beta fold hydrolase [Alphaproteobacteria bacterium]|nr:MAG: alpha/beta fold hydrolase [Alphaproteobacteria bacterium]
MMQTKANGISINYRIDDGAGPWLVLSNSLATDLSMWDAQARELSGAFRVLRYDQRGHGKTDAPAGRYTFDILMADALALMDALGIGKAHFCGLSMGGATALGMAEQHPDRIERAIVADSGCASTPQSAQQWEERIAAAQQGGMEPLVEPTVTRWFPPDVVAKNPPYLDRVRAMIRATPVNGFIGCAAALADHDFRSGVAATRPPVLFLAGEKDAGGAVAAAMRGLHQALPGSRYVELPGAGHISNLDDPAGFTRALRDFIAA